MSSKKHNLISFSKHFLHDNISHLEQDNYHITIIDELKKININTDEDDVNRLLKNYLFYFSQKNLKDFFYQKPLIVHCCHHKTGSVVLRKIINRIGKELDYNVQVCIQSQLKNKTDIWMENHSHINLKNINRPIIGTHMIRNPCAILASAYDYHKINKEPWAFKKIKEFNDLNYREILNNLDFEDGFIFEMKNELFLESSKNTIMDMYNWNYTKTNFLEVKYENLMEDFNGTLTNMLKHYGLHEKKIKKMIKICQEYNLRKNNENSIQKNIHVTNKTIDLNKWKKYFKTRKIYNSFLKIYPHDIFEKLGYITNSIHDIEINKSNNSKNDNDDDINDKIIKLTKNISKNIEKSKTN